MIVSCPRYRAETLPRPILKVNGSVKSKQHKRHTMQQQRKNNTWGVQNTSEPVWAYSFNAYEVSSLLCTMQPDYHTGLLVIALQQ
jgi:hypothetical protein